ncbi:MAG: peptidoglycan DD-metalloendopeptidase family protein [Salinivirgaceae bacterium]|nr:peptidoglycan DD-metalloendopeptidase family protein [Salinivirgaceae bacterium]
MLKYNILLILTFIFSLAFSQSRQELEKRKLQNEKDISYTNELIKKTEKNKSDSFNKLLLINSKITNREKLIKDMNSEINLLNSNIDTKHDLISTLNSDYENLKNEYAKVITFYYKNRSNYDRIMFILASTDVNTAFKRIKYLQQYSEYRTNQVNRLLETKAEIEKQISELETMKVEKQQLLKDQQSEANELRKEKDDQSKIIQSLEKQKVELRKKLDKQIQLANELQREIEKVIAEELSKASKKGPNVFQLTPEEKKLADNFANNKNKLPWPTERGVITGCFGENPHPVLKGIMVRNDGIDISTTDGSYIRSVFDGVVTRVFVIPGAHTTVIIRHGNYLSVYSNLSEVFVKQGDKVKTKQSIGKIFTDDDKSVLQFQIWKENVKLNPQDWLASSKNG